MIELARLSDYTSREKVAIVMLEVVYYGREMTTRQIATRVGLSWKEANEMMNDISRVVPVYKEGLCWRKVDD